jgi:hypothetical protein
MVGLMEEKSSFKPAAQAMDLINAGVKPQPQG